MQQPLTRTATRIGALWSAALWLLLGTIIAWYARDTVPVADLNLTIFFGWLVFVPIAALYLDTKYT